jgi:hypothetical protein
LLVCGFPRGAGKTAYQQKESTALPKANNVAGESPARSKFASYHQLRTIFESVIILVERLSPNQFMQAAAKAAVHFFICDYKELT